MMIKPPYNKEEIIDFVLVNKKINLRMVILDLFIQGSWIYGS